MKRCTREDQPHLEREEKQRRSLTPAKRRRMAKQKAETKRSHVSTPLFDLTTAEYHQLTAAQQRCVLRKVRRALAWASFKTFGLLELYKDACVESLVPANIIINAAMHLFGSPMDQVLNAHRECTSDYEDRYKSSDFDREYFGPLANKLTTYAKDTREFQGLFLTGLVKARWCERFTPQETYVPRRTDFTFQV
jgi:hypothetical protein